MTDNFQFDLVSEFSGYNSSRDKTNIKDTFLVRGSKNVYKKLSGTIASRPGLKTRGSDDTTTEGVKSSWEWNTSLNAELPLRVANSKLQVESDVVTAGTYVWYDLLTSLTKTRFVFDSWWDNTDKKDRLIMCDGTDDLRYWSGGITKVASGTSSTLVKSDTTTTWAQDGFDSTTPISVGTTDTQFDITNTAGSTFRYTFDGTGTDPTITAAKMPIGTYVLINGQNFNAANNGLFLITGSGANYFEVTNAAGVAENNKTIGTGYIYRKYTRVLKIGSDTFAYTGGETTDTLTGVTPTAASVVADSVAIQAVMIELNTPASGFNTDFIKVIGNRLHCGSYTSRLIYISDDADFTNYTVPTPRTPGSPELLTLDNTANGITVRNGNAHISAGTSDWYEIVYSQITVSTTLTEVTKVDKKPTANLQAAYAHEFIDTVGNDIVYLSKDQQLRVLGTFRNLFQAKYPCLSQAVYDELADEDFTGGHLRAIGDFIYITAPVNGRDWMHQTRESVDAQGNITAERLWHPPQIRNIQRFAVIGGVVYGHSNANPMIYQVWDTGQWHDDSPSGEELPYDCTMRMAYKRGSNKNGELRQGLISFDKAYFEGYIAEGVELNANIYIDYQGSTSLQKANLNSIDSSCKFFSGLSELSIGTSPIGDKPLGTGLTDESSDQELLPKFRVISGINPSDCFEYSLEVTSSEPDSRWEIIALGANPILQEFNAVFIRK